MDRAIPPVCCNDDSLVCNRVRAVSGQHKAGLGDRAEYGLVIKNLMCVAQRFGCINTTSQHNEGNTILIRIRDNVDAIDSTRPHRRDQNARRAGHVVCAFSHKTSTILVLA